MAIEEKLLNLVIRKLSYRNHSRQEVEVYLKRKVSEDEIAAVKEVLKKLEEMQLLDDERFADEWVKSRARKGKGQYIVTRELKQKGVDNSYIQEAIAGVDDDEWISSAHTQTNRKMYKFNLLNGYQKRHKIKQYLYQRGYSSQTINAVIDVLEGEGVE